MSAIKDGGSAFPINDQPMVHGVAMAAIEGVTDSVERDRLYIIAAGRAASGMSLRDYFAAKALMGMLAYPGDMQRGSHHNNNDPDGVAIMAYGYADAMLRARGEQ